MTAPHAETGHLDPAKLWSGGAATAVVAALTAVVGILLARGVFGVPVLAPQRVPAPPAGLLPEPRRRDRARRRAVVGHPGAGDRRGGTQAQYGAEMTSQGTPSPGKIGD
jgi:hypothetical protein